MSTKSNLPSELVDFEAKLREQSLSSEIDRDSLMYRAGWAAAEASWKARWGWQATSGMLAASVAVLAFFLVRSSEQLPIAKVEIEQVAPAVEKSHPNLVRKQEELVLIRPAQPWQANTSVLARRHQLKEWDSFDHGAGEVAVSEVKTARALMQEFLNETGWKKELEVEKRGNPRYLFDGRGIL